ncbi:hypothetical protein [Mesobacillus foraminis]|uniref:hypothetical protein n=1 Tax=Mesobacillus foraminis TaxID=279826 RepID=UPI001304EC10|nr:hypothetical protein [Mesobacillus foraminis]
MKTVLLKRQDGSFVCIYKEAVTLMLLFFVCEEGEIQLTEDLFMVSIKSAIPI